MEEDLPGTLREFAARAFPGLSYHWFADKEKGDDQRVAKAGESVQDSSVLASVSCDNFIHCVFPCLDSNTFLKGVRLTCHTFYELTFLSCYYLGAYSLTETRMHSIPPSLLAFKIENTPNCLLQVAAFMSVSEEDLVQWFGQDCLKAAFATYADIPETQEGLTEEELDKLYPKLKVALASGAVKKNDLNDPVIKLIGEYYSTYYQISLNRLRILSLYPVRPGVYYETLGCMIYTPNGYSRDESASLPREVIGKELLSAGKAVAIVNCEFLVGNPKTRVVATELLELCAKFPQLCTYGTTDDATLINGAHFLELPDLAFVFLRRVAKLPIEENNLNGMINSFEAFRGKKIEDKEIAFKIKEFSRQLYGFWPKIMLHDQISALLLLIQADRRADVQLALQDVLSKNEPEVFRYGKFSLLQKELLQVGYEKEVDSLIRFLLNASVEQQLEIISSLRVKKDVIARALELDWEKTIALMEAYVDSNQLDFWDRMNGLVFIHQNKLQDKHWVMAKAESYKTQEMPTDDTDFAYARLYSVLDEPDQCQFYYNKVIQKMLSDTSDAGVENLYEARRLLKNGGLTVECNEDLLTLNPSDLFRIMEQQNELL